MKIWGHERAIHTPRQATPEYRTKLNDSGSRALRGGAGGKREAATLVDDTIASGRYLVACRRCWCGAVSCFKRANTQTNCRGGGGGGGGGGG